VEGPLAKIGMTGTLRRGVELGCAILGPDAQLWGRDAATSGWFQELMVFSPAPGIYGGTDEIQRNIIAERVLKMPKEPSIDTTKPFRDVPRNTVG